MEKLNWQDQHIAYLRQLNKLTEQQKLLLLLVDEPEQTNVIKRQILALLKAERAAQSAQKANAKAAKIISERRRESKRNRDRKIFQAAELLLMTGLINKETGEFTVLSKTELLGALSAIASGASDRNHKAAWKERGEKLLNEPMCNPPKN